MNKHADPIALINALPEEKRLRAMSIMVKLEKEKAVNAAREGFLPFVRRMFPGFIEGAQHRKMADAFERVARGELKRVIINMPPRHGKSELGSYLLPAWFLGLYPDRKVIQASNTSELAQGFGRRVRNLMATEDYTEIFPDSKLSADSKAAGRWNTAKGGQYFAVGVDSAVAGRGADLFIIDDPHSEAEAKSGEWNPAVYDRTYEWYTSGPRQRLQPGGAIILIQTRWHLRDLTGQIIKKAQQDGSTGEWEIIELPAILPSGTPLWPEFWSLPQLEAVKRDIPISKWNAQYQQHPTAEEGALIKRDWWQRWDRFEPPKCELIIQSWDTAFDRTERSNYSACTTWGVFMHPDGRGVERPNVIMLHAFREKMEFPDLKRKVLALYSQFEPDQLIIEKRASGGPLIYELRAMGVPVREFVTGRGGTSTPNNKIARVNSVTDLFASSMVWAPHKNFADEVIEECAAFPAGEYDDYVDTVVMAMLMFRQGGWVGTALDDFDDEPEYTAPKEFY